MQWKGPKCGQSTHRRHRSCREGRRWEATEHVPDQARKCTGRRRTPLTWQWGSDSWLRAGGEIMRWLRADDFLNSMWMNSTNCSKKVDEAHQSIRASPAMVSARSPAAVFFIRTAKNGPVAPPVPHFSPDLGLHPSGEPRSSLVSRGALGDSRREKSGDGPALSAREHANPTIWSQIPLSLPSLLCRRRHHPSPIRRPVA
jgi:hypothetical protein